MRDMRVIPSRNGKTPFLVGGKKAPEFTDYVEEINQLVCEGNTVESCQWVDTGLKLEQPRKRHMRDECKRYPLSEVRSTEVLDQIASEIV